MHDRSFADDGWQAWRRARLAEANADDGPAALAQTVWLDESELVPGTRGTWRPVDRGVSDGERFVPFAARERLGAVTVQPVLRAGRVGVRVFDHTRSGRVAKIGAFVPSPAWVVDGTLEEYDGVAVPYGYTREADERDTEVAGAIRFTLGGRTYDMTVFGGAEALMLVFADETTGTSTKPPGRFLDIAPPVPGASEVRLDFNRAYLPPCAFSDEFNCPVPPAANRVAIAVTAGETFATFRRAPSGRDRRRSA